jgi:ribosomal protein L30
MAKLRITYRKSSIGYSKDQKATIQSLGLRKLNSVVVREDTPSVRGMLFKVQHLVGVEEVGDDHQVTPSRRVQRTAPAAKRTSNGADGTDGKPDDLEIVEGIGPKIAATLQAAGISTFAQLAAADVTQLAQILREANVRLADPTTWPQQAQLAHAGQWDKLRDLQEKLQAGRQT